MVAGQKVPYTLFWTGLTLFLVWGILPAGTSGEISVKTPEGSDMDSSSVVGLSSPPDSAGSSPLDRGDLAINLLLSRAVAKVGKSGYRNSATKDIGGRGVVEAERANIQMEPFATEHITSEAIERMPISDIEEILANQVGVVRMWRPGYEGLHFHGGGSR